MTARASSRVAGLILCLYPLTALFGSLAGGLSPQQAERSRRRAPTTVEIRNEVLVSRVKRFGVGLNWRDRWGAGQFVKNIIENPGYEATVWNSVILADQGATGRRVPQANWDTSWNDPGAGIGQPEGFWKGASFEVLSGPAKGRTGEVADFTHEENRYTFHLDSDGVAPEQWDAVAVKTEIPGLYGYGAAFSADTSTVRPGSPGSQSLRLAYTGESWDPAYVYYMDSSWRDGDRTSGKLFIIDGSWHLEFWARGAKAGDRLRVRFFRENEADFFDETFDLAVGWQRFERNFYVPPGTDPLRDYSPEEYHPVLGFNYYIPDPGGEAWVDDAALYRSGDTNPTVFTDRLVDRLKELRPGILRDWSNHQLGNSLDNMLAVPAARKTSGCRPDERYSGRFSYGLHEFLELCEEIGAEPWCVFSPSFSPEEIRGLVEYLAAPAEPSNPYASIRAARGRSAPWTNSFPTVHLEFGNELWGSADPSDPMFGGSLRSGNLLGAIGSDRIAVIKSSPFYSPSRFNLIIGGQAGWPPRQLDIETNATSHDAIALSPYYQFDPEDYGTEAALFRPVFAQPFDNVTAGIMRQSRDYIDSVGRGTGLAVYEINFHTTGGEAPLEIRNDLVTGTAGGISLPLHMLVYLRDFGIRDQCAFSLHGYSTNHMTSGGEWVRIFGLLRDLEVTGRARPTWLGLRLANLAVQGDMLRTVQGGENPSWRQPPSNGVLNPVDVNYVQSFAFRAGDRYGLLLFNLDLEEAREVILGLPSSPVGPAALHRLAPESIHSDNEESLNVEIETERLSGFRDGYGLVLPPHSVTAIGWRIYSPGASGDFDGDGTSDIAIFRASSGLWAIRGVARAYFGSGDDIPVPGDYNGDGTSDFAIFRPASGLWAVRGVTRVYFGTTVDIPLPRDYIGDGMTDLGIFRPSSGLWAIRQVTRVYFGRSGDTPVPGYYDGTRASPAVFRPGLGLWAIRGVTRVYFGTAADIPVPGDYSADGRWRPAIFRPGSGLWAVRGVTRAYFGTSADHPVPGGYSGDGTDDIGIFRGSSGLWAIRGVTRAYFGSDGDIPVVR